MGGLKGKGRCKNSLFFILLHLDSYLVTISVIYLKFKKKLKRGSQNFWGAVLKHIFENPGKRSSFLPFGALKQI